MSVVTFDPSNHNSSNPTLLHLLESQGLEPMAHCREGYCGCCRTKLKSGSVEYTDTKIGFTRDGEILPCI